MPGRNYDKLALIAAEREGLLAAADAREAGIDPHRLVDMERRGTIELLDDLDEVDIVVAEPTLAVDWLGRTPRSLDELVSAVDTPRPESLAELRNIANFRKFEAASQNAGDHHL